MVFCANVVCVRVLRVETENSAGSLISIFKEIGVVLYSV